MASWLGRDANLPDDSGADSGASRLYSDAECCQCLGYGKMAERGGGVVENHQNQEIEQNQSSDSADSQQIRTIGEILKCILEQILEQQKIPPLST